MGHFCWIDDFFPFKMYVKKMSKCVYFHMNFYMYMTYKTKLQLIIQKNEL